ncbi:MAG TPA: hypothetical protein VKD71_15385, partial [Gemmataceae bacterium]|nr:hypothetical protein [Gemmataceae bacterium]
MAQAPEWRYDPLTGRLVLISPERAERPLRPTAFCPFCEGHETETPPEVVAYREPDSQQNGPGWRVRVVPNRYAAVRMDATGPPNPGVGVAEVFIECPHHETKFRNLTRKQVADVLRAWRDQFRFWRDDGRLAFAQIFHNEGPAAGASVEHCHSQLIGIPFVPPEVAEELDRLSVAGACPFCRWIETGRTSDRFVMEMDDFVAFCPVAPRFPGETWLLPKFHIHAFDTLADDSLDELAGALLDLLSRVSRALGDPDYNLILKLPPFRDHQTFHWRIELLPRITSTAGWE